MKNIIIRLLFSLILPAALTIAISCEKDPVIRNGAGPQIIPEVKGVLTKASDSQSLPGELISERIVSSADGFDLIEMVYENDFLSYTPLTKGAVTTTGTLTGFGMMVYAEDEWYDNAIADGQQGSKSSKNPAGLYFEATSTKSGSSWPLTKTAGPADGGLYWLNDVPMTFWSWNSIKPTRVSSNSVSFEHTVSNTASAETDPVFAYSSENRKYHDDGANYGSLESSSSSSGASASGVNLWFFHALSAVQFLQNDTLARYRISKIQIKNVNSHTSCVISGSANVPSSGNPNITFSHTSDTPATFSQEYTTGDVASGGSLKPGSSTNYKPDDSKTFMMIPQTLPSNAALEVTFTNTTSSETTSPVFQLTGSWADGKYYIYKIGLSDAIRVEISETVTTSTKSDVGFKNSSRMNEYIRAAVVANWYDANGNIVAPWTGSISAGSGWTANGGFYYHDNVVKTGESTSNLISSFTKPTTAPVTGAHFEMTILVQAVAADGATSCMSAFN